MLPRRSQVKPSDGSQTSADIESVRNTDNKGESCSSTSIYFEELLSKKSHSLKLSQQASFEYVFSS